MKGFDNNLLLVHEYLIEKDMKLGSYRVCYVYFVTSYLYSRKYFCYVAITLETDKYSRILATFYSFQFRKSRNGRGIQTSIEFPLGFCTFYMQTYILNIHFVCRNSISFILRAHTRCLAYERTAKSSRKYRTRRFRY